MVPVSFRPPLHEIVEPSVYSKEALPSRVLILNQIMDALKDPNLKTIGVYGMGGVGKTTLAKEVMRRAIQEKMLFDTVVMIAVSQYPDLRRIQGEIADSLGLELDAEGVPGRASRLRQRLEKAKVLIILDDVWLKLDLSVVGIPSADACQGCKILVTSRSREVLRSYEMLTREFSLDVLNQEEAWRLFKMSSSNIADPELHDIATEIVNKCAGLPLLILKVAADLQGKESYTWKAHKKALAVGKKLQDAQAVPDPVSFVEPSVYSKEAMPSRLLILNQIMDALKDPNLKTIGVYGFGGVGKTTLAKEVMRRAIQEKMLFDTVVMIAVSQDPDLRTIQGEIADSLGLELDAEEVPRRASRLYQRLEEAKVLIILDDVWQNLDLSVVGIPSGDACQGCKILFTSRSREVLRYGTLTQTEFLLDVLNQEEAWRLFKMSTSNIADPELHDIATEIVNKCAGLPLLILKVAADLPGKEFYAWKDMSKRLSTLENTDIYEKVHRLIESSYENLLDAEAKSIFLLCALFGGSHIEIHKLLMYSVGLELFKGIDSIEEGRNRVLALIDKLKDGCLLMDADKDGFVKIHDVVRDVALRVQNVFVGAGKVRCRDFRNRDCRRFSLPYCDISDLPGVLECPEVEMFLLFAGGDHVDIQSPFFERVPKLKVVDFSGVCFVSGLPSSLGFLQGLQSLCLQRCRFNNVAIVAELKQLEVLSFADSNIMELPGKIKGLTRLKLLDLGGCRRLKVLPANVLSNMSLLEELYMLNSFDGWETDGNASLVELKDLSHLTTLEIQVLDYKLLPEDWFFNGMHNYKISIGKWPGFWNETSRRMLKLEVETSVGLTHKIKELVRGIEVLHLRDVKGFENLLNDFGNENTDSGFFGKLRKLCIYECDTLKNLFSHPFSKYLPQLQELEVESCCNMEAIAGEGSGDEVIEFTQLTSLRLSDVPNLRSFPKTSGMVNFSNLEGSRPHLNIEKTSIKYYFVALNNLVNLKLEKCYNCVELPCLGILPHLENLEMNHMKALKFIDKEFYGIDYASSSSSGSLILFPALQSLSLTLMENLTEWSYPSEGKTVVVFPSLRILSIQHCPKLTGFPMRDISQLVRLEIKDCNELRLSNQKFTSLTGLSISGCSKLTNLRNWIQSIESFKVKELSVRKCEWLTFIPYDLQKVSYLTSLEIYFCRRLRYFPEVILSELIMLRNLSIGAFSEELDDFRYLNRIKDLPLLEELEIWGSDFFSREMCSLPNQLQHLSFLKSLKIMGFSEMEALPEWLTNLQSLHTLSLDYCRNLECESTATIVQRLPNLLHLSVSSCPILQGSESEWLQPLHSRNIEVEVSNVSKVRVRLGYY